MKLVSRLLLLLPWIWTLLPFVAAQTKPYTDLRDYGIVGEGSRAVDQAKTLQAAIDATPDGGEVRCAAGTIMYVSRINVIQRNGLRFTAAGNSYADGSCVVRYVGADNGTLLNLDSSYDVSFDGWSFHGTSGNNASVGAQYVVSINKMSTGRGIGKRLNSSHHTFRNGVIQTGTTKRNAVGVIIGDDPYGNNSEFMHFENMNICGWHPVYAGPRYGTGVKLMHANVKGISFERVNIGMLDKFIENYSGSYKAHLLRGGDTNTVYYGNGSEKTEIDGDNFEDICQVLVVPAGYGGDFRFSGGRYQAVSKAQGCATANKPLFEMRGGGVLELDYPVADAATPTALAADKGSQATLILHGGSALAGVGSLATFHLVEWFSQDQGLVVGGNGTSPSGVEPGFHFFQANGSFLRGWYVRFPLALSSCGNNNLCLNDGQMEIVGLSAADSPRLAVHGRGGSRQLLIHLYAKDSQGHRALSSPEAIINNAPNNPSAADFITVSLESRLAGAVSFDIAHRCSDGSFALVGSAVTLPYRIEAAPACPGNYQPPGYNESAAVNLRAPQGIRALGPFLAFTDNTYDIGASGANRPRTGYFATSVVTPKLAGITDSGTVINLNADRVDGHHASDFTAAPVSAPRSSRAACAPGQWAYDSGYIYVCTATNTWKRSALAAW